MKTLQEFYTEIMASDELKKSFVQAAKENKQLEFVKERGVETTADELNTFLVEKAKLAENELDNVAGGEDGDGRFIQALGGNLLNVVNEGFESWSTCGGMNHQVC